MKKAIFAMLAMAAALSAQAAKTIELLTNGDGTTLEGWSNDLHGAILTDTSTGTSWFGSTWSEFTVSQTITLSSLGITEDDIKGNSSVTASAIVWDDGYPANTVCNVKVYQLDAGGNDLGTLTVLDKAGERCGTISVMTNFTLHSGTRKIKYELNGASKSYMNVGFFPRFRNCSLTFTFSEFTFVSAGATLGTAGVSTPPIASRNGDDIFLGYFTEPTGGVQVFNANYEYVLDENFTWEATEGATLYAHWQPVARTLEGGITRLVYRGVLTNFGTWTSGLKKTMHVKVYDSASAAEPLWSGDVADVPINPDGSFEAVFGNDELALAFASNDVTHVELTVGDALSPLAPRRAFASVASVNRALVAEGAASDIKVGTLGANALIAEKITAGTLEASETVRVEGSVSVEVKPFDIKRGQETTIWRGAGVTAWGDPEHVDTFNGVVAGQKLWTADRDGVVMIHCSGDPRSTLRIPATIQFVRPGDEVRAPTWDSGKVSVTVWGYKR